VLTRPEKRKKILTRPAETVNELSITLRPEPLIDPDLQAAFYEEELNTLRGLMPTVKGLADELTQMAESGGYFKGCFYGHPGCGKTTELQRLGKLIDRQYESIYIDLEKFLDQSEFDALDIVLIIMEQLLAYVNDKEKNADRFKNLDVNADRLEDIQRWYTQETTTWHQQQDFSAQAGAGIEFKNNPIAWLTGAFAQMTAHAKFASNRTKEVIEKRRFAIDRLVTLCNNLITDFSIALEKLYPEKQWFFILDGLEKENFDETKIRTFFTRYGNTVIRQLDCSMLFTVPIWICYDGEASVSLPFTEPNRFVLPDIHVYAQDHSPYPRGRKALEHLLARRMNLTLFESEAVREKVIVASGGCLRDLFDLIQYASRSARLQPGDQPIEQLKLSMADVDYGIANKRSNLEMYLGERQSCLCPFSCPLSDARATPK
jgi:hypothetical protein